MHIAHSLIAVLVIGTVVCSQSPLIAVVGDAFEAQAGRAVSGAGDVNLDGYDDIVVGAPYANGVGAVSVYSGLDGALLWTAAGAIPQVAFGICATGLGDIDDDGVPDVVVGATPVAGQGAVHVLSGVDGATLRSFGGTQFGELFGFVVDAIDDLDGDGVDDILVAAPDWNSQTGRVAVHSGRTGAELLSLLGDEPAARFGIAISRTGDLDGNGYDDLVVGALQAGDQQQGRVYVYTLASDAGVISATETYVLSGMPNMHHGSSVSDCGDLDADGVPDFVAGGYFFEGKTGAATAYSGADGSMLHFWTGDAPGQLFGTSVTGFSDVDADGHADVLIGSVGNPGGVGPGLAQVFCGRTGAELYRLAIGDDGAQLGTWADAAGDVDGDGFGDAILGAPFSSAALPGGGFAIVISGSPWRDLGEGLAGVGGVPQLIGTGAPAGGSSVTLTLANAKPLSPVVFVVSATTNPVPFFGGVLVPTPTLAIESLADTLGAAAIATTWPSLPPSSDVYLQVWVLDGAAPQGLAASNALHVTTLAACAPIEPGL